MKEYNVYFDIFGKKLKAKVKASTPEEAGLIVRKTLTIDKIELRPPDQTQPKSPYDQMIDELGKMMGDDFKDLFKR